MAFQQIGIDMYGTRKENTLMFVQGIGGDAMYKTAFAILKYARGTLDVIRERRNRVSHIKSICLQIYDFIF